MFSLSKQRTTCTIASTSRIWDRNLLPRPSPLLAPRTRPAMSTNSTTAGVVFLRVIQIGQRLKTLIRYRYHADIRVDGAERIVCALSAPACVIALNKVDLPTLGRPTMPSFICFPPNSLKEHGRRPPRGHASPVSFFCLRLVYRFFLAFLQCFALYYWPVPAENPSAPGGEPLS